MSLSVTSHCFLKEPLLVQMNLSALSLHSLVRKHKGNETRHILFWHFCSFLFSGSCLKLLTTEQTNEFPWHHENCHSFCLDCTYLKKCSTLCLSVIRSSLLPHLFHVQGNIEIPKFLSSKAWYIISAQLECVICTWGLWVL